MKVSMLHSYLTPRIMLLRAWRLVRVNIPCPFTEQVVISIRSTSSILQVGRFKQRGLLGAKPEATTAEHNAPAQYGDVNSTGFMTSLSLRQEDCNLLPFTSRVLGNMDES